MPCSKAAKSKTEQFMEDTSIHGMTQIRKGPMLKSICWAILFLSLFSMLIYQMVDILERYYSYQTLFKVKRKTASKIVFPAITICNANNFQKSEGLLNLTDDADKIAETMLNTTIGGKFTINTLRYQRAHQYRENAHAQTKSKSQYIPMFLPNLLETCIFGLNQVCNISSDFSSRISPIDGGDCYTFNYDRKYLQQGNGVVRGLSMILFVNQSDYIPAVGNDLGVGVSIVAHSQERFPFAQVEGVTASTGFSTRISLEKISIRRKTSPYPSRCSDGNGIKTIFPGSYSILNCQLSCFYLNLYDQCGDVAATVRKFMPKEKYPKRENKVRDFYQCKLQLMDKLLKNSDGYCNCPLPCSETKYVTKVSSTTWPSLADLPIYKILFGRILGLNHSEISDTYMYSNFLKVDIYFEEIAYQEIFEESQIQVSDLLGTIGGQLGLWIGASFFSVAEFLVFCGSLVILVFGETRVSSTKNGQSMTVLDR